MFSQEVVLGIWISEPYVRIVLKMAADRLYTFLDYSVNVTVLNIQVLFCQ
jgi:hypothetical protein